MINYTPSQVPLSGTPLAGGLVKKYLEADPEIKPLIYQFPDDRGFIEAVSRRKETTTNREVLVDTLSRQYRDLEKSGEEVPDIVKRNIEKLSSGATLTVTTGHQLQLAGGPLFFTYKLLTTIRLADELKHKFSDLNIVPVFWMATEDHDIAEIDHFFSSRQSYQWDTDYHGPAGKALCTNLETIWQQLENDLSGKPFTGELMELLRAAYVSTNNLSLATRIFVNRLFGKYGLLILDPDDARLKAEMIDIFSDELISKPTYRIVNDTINQHSVIGNPQVNPREINLFYINESGRHRIVEEGDKLMVLDGDLSFTKEEIITELSLHPERFSPNVLLRPVYQEKILPNLAYVGGPGEMAYWLECKMLFDHFNILFPLLVPRNNLLLIDPGTENRMTKLGWSDSQLFTDPDSWIREYTGRHSELTDPFPALSEKITTQYEALQQELIKIDPTLSPVVLAEQQKALKGLSQIKDKWIRAEKRKQETAINQFHRVRDSIFPNGTFQERHESLLGYYANYGSAVLDSWINHIQPGDGNLTVLREIVD